MSPRFWFLLATLACIVSTRAGVVKITGTGQVEAPGRDIRVLRGQTKAALFGHVTHESGTARFVPALPLLPGETYRVEFQHADGTWTQESVIFHAPQPEVPTVTLSPAPAELPANALKLYLHFSLPMEQGVFLERITLQRQDGSVVEGALRETELWSPDGKRLTLWLHPGRQKTGVNLNRDEGPVLIEGQEHLLKLHPTWRSTAGTPLGHEISFTLRAGPPDHTCPNPRRWEIKAPKASTREALVVHFDEPLDSAMLTSALQVKQGEAVFSGTVTGSADARSWSFAPAQPWQPGTHHLVIDPLLEDLAGNNLMHPFEVDRESVAPPSDRPTQIAFEVAR